MGLGSSERAKQKETFLIGAVIIVTDAAENSMATTYLNRFPRSYENSGGKILERQLTVMTSLMTSDSEQPEAFGCVANNSIMTLSQVIADDKVIEVGFLARLDLLTAHGPCSTMVGLL